MHVNQTATLEFDSQLNFTNSEVFKDLSKIFLFLHVLCLLNCARIVSIDSLFKKLTVFPLHPNCFEYTESLSLFQ